MRKLDIGFIRDKVVERGYKLLSTEYIGANSNLVMKCPEGHEIKMCWTVFKRGASCVECFYQSMRIDIEFIRAEFKKKGYILLTTKYINNNQKLDYICPKGHRGSVSWSNWGKGAGNECGICVNNVRLTVEFIGEEFKKEGWDLLSTEYINNRTKLKYRCKRGHTHYTTWGGWADGCRCPTCWAESITGSGNHGWKGGISKEPYCQDWTKDLKDLIKERDGHKCMNPYCFKKTGYATELVIHHIDYNKKNCRKENLITTCRSCNGMANKNVGWHEAWYKAIMYRRYNYKY